MAETDKPLTPEEEKAKKAAEKAEREAKAEATAKEKEEKEENIKVAAELEKKLKADAAKEADLEKRGYAEVKKLNGEVVRAYTQKDHGKDFLKKAREFAKKNGYAVV